MTFEESNKERVQMQITVKLAAMVIAFCVMAAPVSVMAHHSFAAAFDQNKQVNLQGTVTKVELVNPHAWLWIDVKGPDGKITNWGIEGGPPANLFKNGITKTSLPIGTEIKVFAFQAKSGESKAVGVFVEYLDGRKVFLGGSAPGALGK
jgi:hypothetical protein